MGFLFFFGCFLSGFTPLYNAEGWDVLFLGDRLR